MTDSKLFRQLSSVLLVSSAAFAKESPTGQTKLLQNAKTPVVFVPDFVALQNRRLIRDRLLSGLDVSRELEFNGIELSEEERRVMALVSPILNKIGSIGPVYEWLNPEETFSNWTLSESKIQRGTHADHSIGIMTAKKLWKAASEYWSGGKKPAQIRAKGGGSSYYGTPRYAEFTPTNIVIGCQTISRAEVEYIARAKGWEPTVFGG